MSKISARLTAWAITMGYATTQGDLSEIIKEVEAIESPATPQQGNWPTESEIERKCFNENMYGASAFTVNEKKAYDEGFQDAVKYLTQFKGYSREQMQDYVRFYLDNAGDIRKTNDQILDEYLASLTNKQP